MKDIFKTIINFILETIQSLVLAMSVFVVCYLFFFQPTEVIGSSMEPNFQTKDRVFIEKVSYRFSSPDRGDVIVLNPPFSKEVEYYKRVIGIPEDEILISQGKVHINNNLIPEPYLKTETMTNGGSFLPENKIIKIPKNYYFVMGDNREHSSDSREWGLVPKENIVGKAVLRWWPANKSEIIK